jgi:hypothetical protein
MTFETIRVSAFLDIAVAGDMAGPWMLPREAFRAFVEKRAPRFRGGAA